MTSAPHCLDPTTGAPHEPEMRRSVSDNGPTGSDGVPSDTTEDDWSRGSADDPDDVLSPTSSPSPSPVDPPEHVGPVTELDRKVKQKYELSLHAVFFLLFYINLKCFCLIVINLNL